MTDELVRDGQQVLERNEAFEKAGDAFDISTTPFPASVTLESAGHRVAFGIRVQVPLLNSIVRGEEVAPVVQEGWFETFELRVKDLSGVTRSEPLEPLIDLDQVNQAIEIKTEFETENPTIGAEDAKAVVDFIEGTYLEGVIPGYDYRDPVAGLLERAWDRSNAETQSGPPL